MYSIKNNINKLYEIEKSKFYTYIYKIDNINEINNYLNELKNEYKDATHYCYAYIVDGMEKCSDDGEPSGTAGIPILNILKQNNLNHVLCVVIRYFGGIKLGAGGLVRAYGNSAKEALNKTTIIELNEGYLIKIIFSYDNIKQVDYLLKDSFITYKEYDENVIYEIQVKKEDYLDLSNKLKMSIIKEEIIKEILI